MTRSRRTVALAAVIVLHGCISSRSNVRRDAGDGALAARINAIGRDALADVVGVSIAVARGDRIVHARGYGFADREHGVAMTAETEVRIASVSKQFIAAAVMRLAEQKRLALDDELSRYLPSFPLQGHRVTIRQLLQHTSGIHSYTDKDTEGAFAQPRRWTPADLVATFAAHSFDFEPGTRWSYSNSGYLLLALVVEQVTGVGYAEYLGDQLTAPVGLARTFDCGTLHDVPGLARGYAPTSERDSTPVPAKVPDDGSAYASGSLCSNALELVRWQRALHHDPRLLGAGSRRDMATPVLTADRTRYPFGLGVFLGELDGHSSLAHGGIIEGFCSMVAYYPADDVTIVVLANTETPVAFAIASRVARAALGLADRTIGDLPVPAADRKAITGRYEVAGSDWTWTITEVEGQIAAQLGDGPSARMLRQADGHFVVDNRAHDELSFEVVDGAARTVKIVQFGLPFVGRRISPP